MKKYFKNHPGYLLPALLVAITVLFLWLVNFYVLIDLPNEVRGTFGDMFGGLHTLFSGLAFAGVITAILLQRKELELQRKELEVVRGELTGQKKQFESQSRTLKLQSFENTFFELLRLINYHSEAVSISEQGRTVTGKDAFLSSFSALQKKYMEVRNSQANDSGRRTDIKDICDSFFNEPTKEMRHYFRLIMDLFEFVDNSYVDNKLFYCNLVKNQLAEMELILFFYFCISSFSRKNFINIITTYSTFENLQIDLLLEKPAHFRFFPPEAYLSSHLY